VPATARMRDLFHAHEHAAIGAKPLDEVLGEFAAARAALRGQRLSSEERGKERPTPAVTNATAASGRDVTAPRVVIVGGGLAGIRCAHALWTGQPALAATIYEAATDHVGGRCWSLRGFFDNGLVTEHGGSFINGDESTIRELAASLGLTELEVDGGDLPDGDEVFWVDGSIYSYRDANADWNAIGYRTFLSANQAAPWPQSYKRHTPEGARLDRLNVPEWLDEVGIGATSRFGKLMQQNAASEFGGDPADQSVLNLLSLLPSTNRHSLDPLPGYDEKYVIDGGNDQIVTRMIAALPSGSLQPGHRLTQVVRESNGSYCCTFDTAGGTVTTTADYLVLTLPFRMLREVDLSRAGFSPLKMRAINELGFGPIGKIHVQLSSKPWVALGYAGGAYSDLPSFGLVWDDSVQLGPAGTPSLMTIYPCAGVAESRLTLPGGAAHGAASGTDIDWFMREVEHLYPGMRGAFMGKAFQDNWPRSPHHRGALAYWRVGQVTAFSRTEGAREGNALFAGEHTARGGTGFMNSAVESGERAARQIRLLL
jgi:monoamine oxidase